MTTSSIPTAPALIILTVTMKMHIDANGEEPEYLAQRMNSALYQAIHQAGLTRGCPDSQATVEAHQFNVQVDQALDDAEHILLAGGEIGAGDAMALFDMPQTVQEGFAAGWNKHLELTARQAHAGPADAEPAEQFIVQSDGK